MAKIDITFDGGDIGILTMYSITFHFQNTSLLDKNGTPIWIKQHLGLPLDYGWGDSFQEDYCEALNVQMVLWINV